ncbi:hypothetical protein BDQ17DRAFT_1350616 [Cyathus striatus]|nr:hypothetical protein BDQ17DRAFT_1350616 [Cyathus striatus]
MQSERAPLLFNAFVDGPSHVPGLVPSDRSKEFRTLVVLFDGTGDKTMRVTNVIELRNMLHGWDTKGDGDSQLQQVYYQRGIGTYNPQFPNTNFEIPVIGSVSETVDQAIAWSLEYHVTEGYEWLADRYRPGDKICLFGFSRGAYTARALAGMLSKVGLIPAGSPKGTGEKAFKSYQLTGEVGWKDSKDFRYKNKTRNVTVEFLGCWDTVNSVGLITAKSLPYTAFNKIVRNFRHAVSLDEHRARFKTNMWGRPRDDNNEKKTNGSVVRNGSINSNGVQNGSSTNGSTTASGVQTNGNGAVRNRDIHGHIVDGKHHTMPTGEDLDARKPEPPVTVSTDVDEVWFAGCHCDIGGGSVPNGTRPNLAHIPLRWMIREIFKTNSGMIFTKAGLLSFGLHPETLYPAVLPRPAALSPDPAMRAMTKPIEEKKPGILSQVGSWLWNLNPFASPQPKKEEPLKSGFEEGASTMTEEQLDLRDALAPIYDQLVLKYAKWWALEVYPMKVWSVVQGKYIRKQNKGRGRRIPPPLQKDGNVRNGDPRWYKVRVHSSVKARMEAVGEDGSRYEPKAMLDAKEGETLSKLLERGLVQWVD